MSADPLRSRIDAAGYLVCFGGIVRRELLRFLNQTGRFFSALVRPLVWLFIFAAGFRSVLGLSITPPYETYVLYDVYVVPGLAAMIQLFAGMQSSLSMVYDREVGSMRLLLTSPFPRWSLLFAKLAAGVVVSLVQVYVFIAIAQLWGTDLPRLGLLAALPAFILVGLMLGAMGLFLSSLVRQLENFASVMNFVIFPLFFASSALYPLWRIRESSEMLYRICLANPFNHAVELIRFALYLRVEPVALAVVLGTTLVFFLAAVAAYDPGRGVMGPPRRPSRGPDMSRIALLVIAATVAAAAAQAQPRPDPDWPCVQRRVSTIGAASVWTGPDPAAAGAWQDDPAVAALAHKLASRRTTLEEADTLLDAFAQQAGAQRGEKLTRLFAGVLALTNAERGRVLEGISRYARGQERLAERIRDEADKISAAKDSPQAETPKNLADLETSFTWDKRIFEERSQALNYVCEVPTLLEERLGDIARRISSRL